MPKSLLLLIVIVLTVAMPAAAQSATLTETGEYNIGLECPLASTLDPSGATVRVLTNDCGSAGTHLLTFNVADGTPVAGDDLAAALTSINGQYIDIFTNPLVFTPDGNLSLYYLTNDAAYVPANLRLPVAGAVSTAGLSNDNFNTLLSTYTSFPETTVYNADHTRAVAIGASSFHVLDLTAGTEILTLDNGGDTFGSFVAFAADGQSLYITRLNEPDNFDVNDSTLSVYSLPGGELTATYAVPSYATWVSPNGQLAAVRLVSPVIGASDELIVVNLATGAASAPVSILESAAPVTVCLNDNRDVTGQNYVAAGKLLLTGLHWLPDSSGFVTLNSYHGEGTPDGTCKFDYSRLRTYSVS